MTLKEIHPSTRSNECTVQFYSVLLGTWKVYHFHFLCSSWYFCTIWIITLLETNQNKCPQKFWKGNFWDIEGLNVNERDSMTTWFLVGIYRFAPFSSGNFVDIFLRLINGMWCYSDTCTFLNLWLPELTSIRYISYEKGIILFGYSWSSFMTYNAVPTVSNGLHFWRMVHEHKRVC